MVKLSVSWVSMVFIYSKFQSQLKVQLNLFPHSDGQQEIVNHPGGHLLRTKAITTREGGVAAGFAVIDSPLLVEEDDKPDLEIL